MLTGGSGQYATYVSQIGGTCASLAAVHGTTPESTIGQFGEAITPSTTRTPVIDREGIPFTAACDAAGVVTGITGRTGALVDKVGFVCRPILVQPLN
jgi:hypothetical protein